MNSLDRKESYNQKAVLDALAELYNVFAAWQKLSSVPIHAVKVFSILYLHIKTY